MTTITFIAHSTTYDNEAKLASGHNDIELSPLGIEQAKEVGQYYKNADFAAIFCSDLQRSYKTAEIAFGGTFPIIRDARLRECDYGELTQHPKAETDAQRLERIATPFPGGESYAQCMDRMQHFLENLAKDYDGKHVLIIGHRATQYGLEHLILGKPLEEVVTDPWQWQPGWEYELITD